MFHVCLTRKIKVRARGIIWNSLFVLKINYSNCVTSDCAEVQKSRLLATRNVCNFSGCDFADARAKRYPNQKFLKDAEFGFAEMNSVRVTSGIPNIKACNPLLVLQNAIINTKKHDMGSVKYTIHNSTRCLILKMYLPKYKCARNSNKLFTRCNEQEALPAHHVVRRQPSWNVLLFFPRQYAESDSASSSASGSEQSGSGSEESEESSDSDEEEEEEAKKRKTQKKEPIKPVQESER